MDKDELNVLGTCRACEEAELLNSERYCRSCAEEIYNEENNALKQ
ncbi:hypothetical protein [Paenibacillus sp. FSL P4-0127]